MGRELLVKTGTILLFTLMVIRGNSQSEAEKANVRNRQSVVAGKFYPERPDELTSQLEMLFNEAAAPIIKENGTDNQLLAIISPHAGYIYSGKIAASAYNQIDPNKIYENIFIITSSHHQIFKGASIYNQGDYITPLGKVKVNQNLANHLINNYEIFHYNPDAHSNEHSLEVQLPFLQYKMKEDFQIVPIVTGTQYLTEVEEIAKALKPFFNSKNLFIISTDFSHYPNYENAKIADKRTGDAILSNSVAGVIEAFNQNASANIENLVTSLCSWPAVLTLLNMTQDNKLIKVVNVGYQNSGDRFAGKDRVVGYHAVAFVKNKKEDMSAKQFTLNDQEKYALLQIARSSIDEYLHNGKYNKVDENIMSSHLKSDCGAFVTLHKKGKLRGCIGRFVAEEPLYAIVQKMAVAAATQDHRFPIVKKDEMKEIELEISVLTPLRKIESIDEIEMGKHGIYIKKGFASGTFLPQVAVETGWTKEEFLGHCAQNKAQIGWDGWKEADIYVYEALVFAEKELKEK